MFGPVQDFKTNTGHGKLLLDDSLYPEAYATNVNEQVCQHAPHILLDRLRDCSTQQQWPQNMV